MSFLTQYWDVITFYILVVILLYLFRSKFEFQGVIAILKTKLGLVFMTNTGKKHSVFWHRLGLVSITLGFLGMAFITVYLFYGFYQLLFVPSAPPVLSPVIPGVKIPGVPITFPLWYTLIGLFFAVIVHEASHGIWSAAYKIKIKSSGFAFFGPIPGAFVEPDEKALQKRPKRQQLGVMAAGPFANVILAILAIGIAFGIGAAAISMVNQEGVTYAAVQNSTGASAAELPGSGTITLVDGTAIHNTADLSVALGKHKPGDATNITVNAKDYTATLGQSPDTKGKAYLGVLGVNTKTSMKSGGVGWLYELLLIVMNVFLWTYIISFGIGVANLLPIGPLDGGRMFFIALLTVYPEKKAKQVFTRWSFALIILVAILVIVPIIKAII